MDPRQFDHVARLRRGGLADDDRGPIARMARASGPDALDNGVVVGGRRVLAGQGEGSAGWSVRGLI
jgi:hypothetical protein